MLQTDTARLKGCLLEQASLRPSVKNYQKNFYSNIKHVLIRRTCLVKPYKKLIFVSILDRPSFLSLYNVKKMNGFVTSFSSKINVSFLLQKNGLQKVVVVPINQLNKENPPLLISWYSTGFLIRPLKFDKISHLI